MNSPTASDLEIQAFLASDLESVRLDTDAATVAVLLVDEALQHLTARASVGLEDEVRQGSRVPIGLGFAGRIASERRPLVLDRIDSTTVLNPVLRRRGISALCGAPLIFEERLLGVLHIGRLAGSFGAAEVAALEGHADAIARRIVDWRGRVDAAAAAALQEGLTPRLPALPGLDLAARYAPSSQHGVGGDWYDVFPLPDGRVGFAVGDVMGHGLGAATVMGRARSALRAYAIEDDDPASVLARLDRKIQHFEFNQLMTVAYGILERDTGRASISLAGHLAPLLVPRGGGARELTMPVDRPLGVSRPASRHQTEVRVPDGATLFLYTDGLVERRGADLEARQAVLLNALQGAAGVWAEIACADVMSALLGDSDGNDDDVTVLAMRRHDTARVVRRGRGSTRDGGGER
ncbi:GAF domain-containing SpoIIE family protein phosphatase [Jatrophihabitans sp.]|uniref:PP2C family protein-serine/threonine phosphatase n=1 Tax=Jatrophihabitans sp. TaxID=1932789 RepID=UPI0030C78181|nr:serine/threonine phosphatase [Jatrophihabitans sp.]